MTLLRALQGLAFEAMGHRIRTLTGSRGSLEDFALPAGDPGWFGPQAINWRVHAHFTGMLVGGLSSLMVQALHPRALAAVWDHSDFRHDLRGRLGRTAYFVAATTYGAHAMAERTIDRVNQIHAHVQGTDLQGRPYRANEPELIRWVHLTEVSAFARAYQHLARPALRADELDRYVAEMAQIGHRLGAQDLPQTWDAHERALAPYVPELEHDARSREIVQLIMHYPTEPLDQPFMALVLAAAFDIMPPWALQRLERRPACAARQQATRLALQLASAPVQAMLDQHGVAATARRRAQALATPA